MYYFSAESCVFSDVTGRSRHLAFLMWNSNRLLVNRQLKRRMHTTDLHDLLNSGAFFHKRFTGGNLPKIK